MKKIICVLLSLVLFVAPALASEIDFSGYSVEELIQIRNEVDNAIYKKDGWVLIDNGIYVVGSDIAAGSYILKSFALENGIWRPSGTIEYYIFRSEDAIREYSEANGVYNVAYKNAEAAEAAGEMPVWPDKVSETQYLTDRGELEAEYNESQKITLQDGQVLILYCSYGSAITAIKKASTLFMD